MFAVPFPICLQGLQQLVAKLQFVAKPLPLFLYRLFLTLLRLRRIILESVRFGNIIIFIRHNITSVR